MPFPSSLSLLISAFLQEINDPHFNNLIDIQKNNEVLQYINIGLVVENNLFKTKFYRSQTSKSWILVFRLRKKCIEIYRKHKIIILHLLRFFYFFDILK